MANEAVIIELLGDKGDVVRYSVLDTLAIEKGTVMVMSGGSAYPRHMKASSTKNEPVAGIAAAEKVANDGSTTLGVYTYGIFDLKTASTARIVTGDSLITSGANLVSQANRRHGAMISGAFVLGKALEDGPTVTDSDTIQVLVKV